MKTTKEIKIKVKLWLTKPDFTKNNPMPMRVMFGYIERETAKAYLIKVHGKPEPASVCMRCGRKLDHPVSVLYGIGPECGSHWHINPLKSEEELTEVMEEIKKKLEDTTWTGWIPKSGVEELEETGETIEIQPEQPKNPSPESKSNKDGETKPQPAGHPKNDEKPKPKYTLEVTDALIQNLFKELERNL